MSRFSAEVRTPAAQPYLITQRGTPIADDSEVGAGTGHTRRAPKGRPAHTAVYSGPERRQSSCVEDDVEPVILTKKLAEELDGIELSGRDVGDRLCLSADEAALIVAEGWAKPAASGERRGGS